MKIPPSVQALGSLYGMAQTNNNSQVRRNRTPQHGTAGKYEISPEAQSFSAVLEKIRSRSGGVRMDRVQALEKQVQSGTYSVSDDIIAGAMLDMRF